MHACTEVGIANLAITATDTRHAAWHPAAVQAACFAIYTELRERSGAHAWQFHISTTITEVAQVPHVSYTTGEWTF